MKKVTNVILTIFFISLVFSCKKDDVSENCYLCSNEVTSIDVCEENGNFVVDGEVIENDNGATLEDLIRAVENDSDLEGVSCSKK